MTEFQRILALVHRETAAAALERAHKAGDTQAIAEARKEVNRATHAVMRAEMGRP